MRARKRGEVLHWHSVYSRRTFVRLHPCPRNAHVLRRHAPLASNPPAFTLSAVFGGLRHQWLTRPQTEPFLCSSCPSARTFALRLPSDQPSRACPCLRLVVILAACDESVTPTGDFHPISSCPCRAHHFSSSGRDVSATGADRSRSTRRYASSRITRVVIAQMKIKEHIELLESDGWFHVRTNRF